MNKGLSTLKQIAYFFVKQKYEIIVFLAGSIEMSLELVAARIFAPYVGTTTLVWTIIIGMILIFMSLGYHLGGRMADKKHNIASISLYFIISGLWISFIPMLEVVVLNNLSKAISSLEITAFISSIILFGVPCMFLAAVSPYAVKMIEINVKDKDNLGKTSGKISSSSTIGSIIGTFLTGFVLLPLIGSKNIIIMNSLILLGFNLFLIDITKIKNLIINIIVMFVAIIIYMLGLYVYQVSNPVIYKDLDSMYSRIQVYKGIAEDNRELKFIKVGIVGSESLKYEDNEINAYLKYFDLPKYYYKNYNRCLLVGGAGYTYPTEFFSKEENQNVKMDVVEIDPVMTQIAIDDFDLDLSNQNLNNYNQDARSFIKRTDEKYDAIFLDAFKGDQIPYELTTIQFMYEMKEKLKDNGVVISNIISIFKGDGNNFFAYEYATFKKAFDDVIIYRIDNSMDPDERQNMILIGVKGHFDLNDTYKYIEEDLQNNLVLDYTSDKTVITDDLFQIEN